MNTEQLSERLKSLAVEIFPSANRYAVQDGVGRIVKVLERVPAGEYAEMRTALYDSHPTDFPIEPLPIRLRNLHHRLEAEGLYVDANIVWLALEAIGAVA